MPKRIVRRAKVWLRSPWADLSERETLLLNRSAKLYALPLALAVAIPLLVMIYLVEHEAKQRSADNGHLIQKLETDERRINGVVVRLKGVIDEQSKARVQNRQKFAASDHTLCL